MRTLNLQEQLNQHKHQKQNPKSRIQHLWFRFYYQYQYQDQQHYHCQSTSIQTSWPECTVTSFKGRWVGAQSTDPRTSLECRKVFYSGQKPTHLTYVFTLWTSVLPPDGTTLTALIWMLNTDVCGCQIGWFPPVCSFINFSNLYLSDKIAGTSYA